MTQRRIVPATLLEDLNIEWDFSRYPVTKVHGIKIKDVYIEYERV
jgi:hypothetical protein